MEPIDILIERTVERMQELDISERQASMLATETPDALRYIRTRRAMPGPLRLQAIARVLKATPEWLLGQTDDNDYVAASHLEHIHSDEYDSRKAKVRAARQTGPSSAPSKEAAAVREPLNRQWAEVPIYATERVPDATFRIWPSLQADPGSEWHITELEKKRANAQQMRIDRNHVIGHFSQAPISPTQAKSSFGIYLPVTALDPAFESGSPALVSVSRPVREMDIALFHLENNSIDGDPKSDVLVPARTRLIHDDYYEVEQFNGARITLPRDRVAAVYRLYTMSDLLR